MKTALRARLERMTERTIRRLGRMEDAGGMAVAVLSDPDEAAALAALSHGVEMLAAGGEEWARLVRKEINLLALSSQGDSMLPFVRVFVTALPGRDRSDPLYLASRLVWVAAYFRSFNELPSPDGERDRRPMEARGFREQLRFLEAAGADAELLGLVRAQGGA